MSKHPDFVIVCNHGIADGPNDEVVRYVWPERADPHRAHWGVPVAGPSGRVEQTQLTGSQPGGNPFTVQHMLDELRAHHEITCLGSSCRVRPYRSDVAKLQRLFDAIMADERSPFFAATPTVDAVAVSLASLPRARDTARQIGLQV